MKELPAARVVVLDGVQLAPDRPQVMDGFKVNTLADNWPGSWVAPRPMRK